MRIGRRAGQSRGGQIIGALVGLAFTTFFIVFSQGLMSGGDNPETWPQVQAKIVSSELKKPSSSGGNYSLNLTYHFDYKARNYTGHKLGDSTNRLLEAEQWADKFATGAWVTCYVNESDPSQSVLIANNNQPPLFFRLIFFIIPGVIWLGSLLALINGIRGKKGKATSHRSKRDTGGTLFAILFFSVFAAVGTGIFFFLTVRPLWVYMASSDWVETPCHIISSRVISSSDSDGTTYKPEIVYTYQFNGVPYQSDRFNLAVGSSSGYESKKAAVDRFPTNTRQVCLVNPDQPEEALLERDFGGTIWIGLIFGGIFGGVGYGLIFATLFGSKKKGKAGHFKHQAKLTKRRGETVPYGREFASGERSILKGKSRLGTFILLTIIALFWNGIVWTVALGHDRAPVLIILIFGGVGLGLGCAAIYYFLRLFNPQLHFVTAPELMLGKTVAVHWKCTGDFRKFDQLSIELLCQEEVTYRRGTKTHTDKKVAFNQPLFTARKGEMSGEGAFDLTIDSAQMHSFTASNNKVRWLLQVNGDIPRWPDVKDEYELSVLPMQPEALGVNV